MKILIVTPERPGTSLGNSITADRWTEVLRSLGHTVEVAMEWRQQSADVLVALHARRSHASVVKFLEAYPDGRVIVALTGTDLYRDLKTSPEAQRSLSLATQIVALQEAARDELDAESAAKLSIIYQSARPPLNTLPKSEDSFDVCVLSHLRRVKDPLRAAYAARLLPPESRIRIVHAGRVLEPEFEGEVRSEESGNPRYRWLGDQDHDAALQLLARSRLLVLSSAMEGGASAIAEAVVCRVPVLCSDIPGNRGMLGADYPGYFRFEDTEGLANLLRRAETDPVFLKQLHEFLQRLQSRFSPAQERETWSRLLLSRVNGGRM